MLPNSISTLHSLGLIFEEDKKNEKSSTFEDRDNTHLKDAILVY